MNIAQIPFTDTIDGLANPCSVLSMQSEDRSRGENIARNWLAGPSIMSMTGAESVRLDQR